MGGERETTIEDSGKTKQTKFGGFRIHESNSEMHIHDDKQSLKTAIPIAKAWKFWDKIAGEVGKFQYADTVNETVATFETAIENGELDVKMSLQPMKVGGNYKKLNEFLKRSK